MSTVQIEQNIHGIPVFKKPGHWMCAWDKYFPQSLWRSGINYFLDQAWATPPKETIDTLRIGGFTIERRKDRYTLNSVHLNLPEADERIPRVPSDRIELCATPNISNDGIDHADLETALARFVRCPQIVFLILDFNDNDNVLLLWKKDQRGKLGVYRYWYPNSFFRTNRPSLIKYFSSAP